jgi:uridine kinase
MIARTETYADLARRILDRPAGLGVTRLVAVDGPSGAGKTVFADRLAGALAAATGVAPPVVHTDDLLDGWSDQFAFFSRLDDGVLAPLRAGRPGRYRRYSWIRREFIPRWIPVPAADVVLLEGVSAGRAGIRPELTLTAFVTAPSRLRLDRALARDGAHLLPYLERWRLGERAHFTAERTAEHADLVVDGAPDLPHDPDTRYVRLG